jgi:putative transposase
LVSVKLLQNKFVEEYGGKAPKAIQVLKGGFDVITAVLVLPTKYRKRLRITNSLERLNEEIRRRDRVIRYYPHRDSAFQLIGALLMEIDGKWQTGHKYLNMADYFTWCKEQEEQARNYANARKVS